MEIQYSELSGLQILIFLLIQQCSGLRCYSNHRWAWESSQFIFNLNSILFFLYSNKLRITCKFTGLMSGDSKGNMLQCVCHLAYSASCKRSINRIRSYGGVVATGNGGWKNHTIRNVQLHLRGINRWQDPEMGLYIWSHIFASWKLPQAKGMSTTA